jgi:hypothetical protein
VEDERQNEQAEGQDQEIKDLEVEGEKMDEITGGRAHSGDDLPEE